MQGGFREMLTCSMQYQMFRTKVFFEPKKEN